jgi:hypothetical protein
VKPRPGIVAVAALGVAWVATAWGCGSRTAPPRPAAAAADCASIAAEFRRVAEKWFTTPGWSQDLTRSAEIRKVLGRLGGDLSRSVPLRVELVSALLKEDRTDEAVTETESLFADVSGIPGVLDREWRLHYMRGLVYLRLAEIRNCVARHNGECCVFPLRGGGVHEDKAAATEAAQSFAKYVALRPDDLTGRWLLNISHMALGTYPGGVPKPLVIPETGRDSDASFPRWRDVAADCGIVKRNLAGGVIADDFDRDGLIDLMLSSSGPDSPITYYRARQDGTFEDQASAAGLDCQLGGLNLVAGDYDNDGDLDVLVLRGAWMFEAGCVRKSLLRNRGDGTFEDVTRAAGLAEPACPTQVGVWFDYDNDGDLDLFVGNESRMDPLRYPKPADDFPCNLFRNEGDGTFTDVAKDAGVTNDRYTKGATAGDYDGDGWVDLYVSNMGRNRLYHNDGNGRFTDVAGKLGVFEPAGRSFAPWFFDFDDDGHLDVYVNAYDNETTTGGEIASWHLGLPFASPPPRLYRNEGDGTFEDVTRSAGLWRPMAPMGANFGDLDNDGWLDMYLTTGAPPLEMLMPNVMLRNVGGKRFVDVTVAGGFGNLQKGHGVAFVDLDNDGDQDVFNEVGGFFRGDSFYNSLYENPGNQNRFLTLALEGRRSNRMAYGARITVVVKTPSGERALHRAVGSVSSFGGSPARQEIGLGDATAIASVEIWWPASNIRQTFTDLVPNAFYAIVEGDPVARRLSPPRTRLGRK